MRRVRQQSSTSKYPSRDALDARQAHVRRKTNESDSRSTVGGSLDGSEESRGLFSSVRVVVRVGGLGAREGRTGSRVGGRGAGALAESGHDAGLAGKGVKERVLLEQADSDGAVDVEESRPQWHRLRFKNLS